MLRLFIGANNETGEVEVDKLVKLLDDTFSGYTVYETVGRWEGKNENSVIVEIEDERTEYDSMVEHMIGRLKLELNQQAIGYQRLPSIKFF